MQRREPSSIILFATFYGYPVAFAGLMEGAPGLATQMLARLPYSRIRRPVFPLDDI
jgi:microcystin degradation protein MlrC